MKEVRKYVRKCEKCGQKLLKNGVECGKQRWRCLSCGTARICKRKDVTKRNQENTYKNHLLRKETANDVAKRRGVSRRTFSRRYASYVTLNDEDEASSKTIFAAYHPYLIIDATNLNCEVVAIVRGQKYVLTWAFSMYESSSLWEVTLYRFNKPGGFVSDGQKGVLKALYNLWGEDIILQRCHFHIKQNIRAKLTNNPESEAGQDLKWLMGFLSHVNDEYQMAIFVGIFYFYYDTHYSFLGERTYSSSPLSRRKWFYTHRRVRSAYRQIADLLEKDQLFAYITHPELNLPRTTNGIEGGINARLSELLRAHRGMTPQRQRQIVNVFLTSKKS